MTDGQRITAFIEASADEQARIIREVGPFDLPWLKRLREDLTGPLAEVVDRRMSQITSNPERDLAAELLAMPPLAAVSHLDFRTREDLPWLKEALKRMGKKAEHKMLAELVRIKIKRLEGSP